MMMMNFGSVFLLTMLMGGVTDLLDVLPADEFWRIKNVQVTEQAMLSELAPAAAAGDISGLIDELGAADADAREAAAAKVRAMGLGVVPQLNKATENDNPEIAARARRLITELQNSGKAQQVRRLMAIRTAGEKKMKGLLPQLKELTASEEMFVRDYALGAIAVMEGKPHVRQLTAQADAVWKMPPDVRAVLHMSVASGSKVATMADLANVPNIGGPPQDEQQKKKAIDELLRKIIEIADQTGNIRIEGATLGVAGDIGDKRGYVVVMIDGQFDRAAVADLLGKQGAGKTRAVGGIDVIDLAKEFSVMFPSDRQAVLVGGPADAEKPLEALANAFKGNQTPLKQSPEMVKLLEKIDLKQPMWGAMHVTPAYKQLPVFGSLDSLTLSGTMKQNLLSFRFDATGQNEASVREAVAMVSQGVAQMKAMMQQANQEPPQAGMKPMLDSMLKLANSLKVQADPADGTKATLTGEFDAPPQMLLGALFGGFASAGHAEPQVQEFVAPNVEVQPDLPPLPPQ